MEKEIYADGVDQIHFVGNMVRFDYFRFQPVADGEEPKREPFERIIMSPQGFLSMLEKMQKKVKSIESIEFLRNDSYRER